MGMAAGLTLAWPVMAVTSFSRGMAAGICHTNNDIYKQVTTIKKQGYTRNIEGI